MTLDKSWGGNLEQVHYRANRERWKAHIHVWFQFLITQKASLLSVGENWSTWRKTLRAMVLNTEDVYLISSQHNKSYKSTEVSFCIFVIWLLSVSKKSALSSPTVEKSSAATHLLCFSGGGCWMCCLWIIYITQSTLKLSFLQLHSILTVLFFLA